jgi:hypothetical protein
MATPDEIRESELGNKAKSLGCCLRRSPSTDVWAADYGCFLVYETLDCSGESRHYMVSDDPEFEKKAARIIGLYLKPPPYGCFLCR